MRAVLAGLLVQFQSLEQLHYELLVAVLLLLLEEVLVLLPHETFIVLQLHLLGVHQLAQLLDLALRLLDHSSVLLQLALDAFAELLLDCLRLLALHQLLLATLDLLLQR